jgi:GNAT superfamily N-acetyltransferase
MSPFELRLATQTDAEACALLHISCWREVYAPLASPELLELRLADTERWVRAWQVQLDQGPTHWVAVHDSELVGFGVSGPSRDEDPPTPRELYALYVRAAWHGTGIGAALLDRTVANEPCSLWVLEANARARAFYARHGFVVDGEREKYAALDVWEVRMVRP